MINFNHFTFVFIDTDDLLSYSKTISFTLTRVIFKTFLNISEMYRGILFIHSFIQQVFIEQVLSAKHCSKPRR